MCALKQSRNILLYIYKQLLSIYSKFVVKSIKNLRTLVKDRLTMTSTKKNLIRNKKI